MSLKLPAIRCSQTTRADVYQTALNVHDLVPYLLNGYDPRSFNWKQLPSRVQSMYEKLQRKTSPSRRTAMRSYILRRMSPDSYWIGAIPPIVVGMQLPQKFEPSSDDELMGQLRITTRLNCPNILLDGLGRITGFLDIMYDETLPQKIREWAGEAVIPVMIVSPKGSNELSLEEIGQLFHDMNVLTVPVSRGQAVDLDQSDLYIRVVNEIGKLPVLIDNGGCDPRGVQISKKSGVWTTKTVLLKVVRAAAEGPGAHVDHIRDEINDAFLVGTPQIDEIIERFDTVLTKFVEALESKAVPKEDTLLRTATWWVAFGLLLHDLYAGYDGATLTPEKQQTLIRRMAQIDWGFGNPDFYFLGESVVEKSTGRKPTDAHGREIVNRFYGGSKAYYNLAAYIRAAIGLRDTVKYGEDYGTTVIFETRSPAAQ